LQARLPCMVEKSRVRYGRLEMSSLYSEDEKPLPQADETHKIPSAYYKVVYDLKGNSASFMFDQYLPKSAKYCEQKVSNKDLNDQISYAMPKFLDASEIMKRLGC
jgi:endonuclease G